MEAQRVEQMLREADRAAVESIQLLRSAVRAAEKHEVEGLLGDAVGILRELESIELRVELAHTASRPEDAQEHARDAWALARALRCSVLRRFAALAVVPAT